MIRMGGEFNEFNVSASCDGVVDVLDGPAQSAYRAATQTSAALLAAGVYRVTAHEERAVEALEAVDAVRATLQITLPEHHRASDARDGDPHASATCLLTVLQVRVLLAGGTHCVHVNMSGSSTPVVNPCTPPTNRRSLKYSNSALVQMSHNQRDFQLAIMARVGR